jgi:hypothetical protein
MGDLIVIHTRHRDEIPVHVSPPRTPHDEIVVVPATASPRVAASELVRAPISINLLAQDDAASKARV